MEREARGVPSLQHFPNVQATAQGGGGGWRSGCQGWMGGWASRLAVSVWGRGAKNRGGEGNEPPRSPAAPASWIHFHLERDAPTALISPPPRLCRRGRPGLPPPPPSSSPLLPRPPARPRPAPLSGPAARSEPAGRVIGGQRRRTGRLGLR